MCQLSSSHLLIHWVPAKLSNRVMPYGENYCQLQLLFVLIVTDLPLLQGLFSVDASTALSVGLMYVFWHHLLKKGYKKRRCISTSFEFYFHYLSDSYVCAKKAVQVGIMESRALFQVWEPQTLCELKSVWGKSHKDGIWQTMCLAVFPGSIGPIDNLASFNYSCCYL